MKSRIYKPCAWWVVECSDSNGVRVFASCVDYPAACAWLFRGDTSGVIRTTSKERP